MDDRAKYNSEHTMYVIEDMLTKHGPIVIDGIPFECEVNITFHKNIASGEVKVETFEMGPIYIASKRNLFLLDQTHMRTTNRVILEYLKEDILKVAFEQQQRSFSFQWQSLNEDE